MREKRNARYSDQTKRAEMQESIAAKYSTPLAIVGGALLAFPLVDDLTNMPVIGYLGLMAFAFAISVITVAMSESLRRN